MTANIHQRAGSMSLPGHRATIAPITSRLPATEAGIARRLRRLQAEMQRIER
jgi:hypothetical protein